MIVLAIWSLMIGITQFLFICAIRGSDIRDNTSSMMYGMGFAGLINVVCGIILLSYPGATLTVFMTIIGIAVTLMGFHSLQMGFALRKLYKDTGSIGGGADGPSGESLV